MIKRNRHYVVLSHKHPHDLEKHVTDMSKLGWKCQGGVANKRKKSWKKMADKFVAEMPY